MRQKPSYFEAAGTSPHRRQHDPINYFHSFVVVLGMDKFARVLHGWCRREVGEIVFSIEKKTVSCNSLFLAY